MKFKVEIGCDNAAFAGDDLEHETARLLSEVSQMLSHFERRMPDSISLRDSNGNTVGRAWFEGD